MKKTALLAITTVFVSALAGTSFGQSDFPDNTNNHWAYTAVAELHKANLISGYPDGTFKGPRSISRYEMAAMVYEAWNNLKKRQDGITTLIGSMESKMAGGGKAEATELKAGLDALKSQLDGMKGWGDEIAAIKKMMGAFEPELTQLGVNVEQMKKQLGELDGRVTKLEKNQMQFDLGGSLDIFTIGGYSSGNDLGVDVAGRPLGTGRGSYNGRNVGLTRNTAILHELSLWFKSKEDAKVPFKLNIVSGNMLDGDTNYRMVKYSLPTATAFGTQNTTNTGAGYAEGEQNAYIQAAQVDFKAAGLGQKIKGSIGRLGKQGISYILKRPDTTPYFKNERWDSGNWMLDGVDVDWAPNGIKLNLYGGRVNQNAALGAGTLQTMGVGKYNIFTPGNSVRPTGLDISGVLADSLFGGQAGLNIGPADVKLEFDQIYTNSGNNYATFGYPTAVRSYGAEVGLANLGPAAFYGGWAKTDTLRGNTAIQTKNNEAYWLSLNAGKKPWDFKVNYNYVAPLFGGAGDWGRIGMWWNPTDIKGFGAKVGYDAGVAKIDVAAQFLTGTGQKVNNTTGLGTDDKINSMKADITKKLNSKLTLRLGAELVDWDLKARTSNNFPGGKPQERWYTVGLDHVLSDNTMLSMTWQTSDYNSKNTPGFQTFIPYGNSAQTSGNAQNAVGDRARGGLLSFTYTVHF